MHLGNYKILVHNLKNTIFSSLLSKVLWQLQKVTDYNIILRDTTVIGARILADIFCVV